MFSFRQALRSRGALFCLLAATTAATHAAEPLVGMVDDPCPPPFMPSAKLRNELAAMFFEPRALTAEDFRRFLSDPELIQLNEETQRRAQQDWANVCRYRADNASVISRSTALRLVLMGDSITENWALADPTLFDDAIVNRGISGQTTSQMLVRFRSDVVALRPKVVHLLAGTNDIAGNTGPTSAQDYRHRIMSMVEIARANGIGVILGSVPPAASFPWRPQIAPTPIITALNAWLRSYAERENIQYIDYYTSLVDSSGALRGDLGNDGVHPNRKGYAVMRRLLEAKLSGIAR